MRIEFLNPNSNMRVDWGDSFHLSLTRLGDEEIPGIEIMAAAMGLMTNATTKLSLKVEDEYGGTHEFAAEKAQSSTFCVQGKTKGEINRLIPFRLWYSQMPIAGYKATRNGDNVVMHDADFVPYKMVFDGLELDPKPCVKVSHGMYMTGEVQGTIDAIWGLPQEIKHIDYHIDGFVVTRTHIQGAAFRVTAKANRVRKSMVRNLTMH